MMRQIACMVVNPIKMDNFDSHLLHNAESDLRAKDGSFLSLFQKVSVCLLLSMVGPFVVLLVFFFSSSFILPLNPGA